MTLPPGAEAVVCFAGCVQSLGLGSDEAFGGVVP